MKLLIAPRQPFIRLPQSAFATLVMLLGLGALVAVFQPSVIATYVIVGLSFFLLHTFRTTNTTGQRLASQLGDRQCAVSAAWCVLTEPKISPSKFASFLFKLKSIEIEGKIHPTTAT